MEARMFKFGYAILFGCLLCPQAISQQPPKAKQPPRAKFQRNVLTAPVDIGKMFAPSGYMGDGEKGQTYIQIKPVVGEKKRPGDEDNMCIRISYKPGAVGWGGVYWLYPANNWGDQPGRTIKGTTKLVFWAAGEKGGEIVEFKTGGISKEGNQYRDSFEATLGSKPLTKDWQRYEINLNKQDLSSVIGAFAWIATGDANRDGLTFYIDDMHFE
jgi:hypothetical protein